jgi:exonuclease VII large subunit
MIGITLLIVGYWIESITSGQKSLDLKLPAFILSTFLGLLFLLLIPVHIKNLNQINTTALTQIQQTADQAESRIQQEFENLDKITKDPKALEQLKTQLTQIDTVINSGTYQGQQLTSQQIDQLKAQKQQYQSLQELAKKPAELKKRKEELQTQLRDQKQERENQTKITNFKEGLRIGLSSLMLAIGYTVIGWFGLRSSMSTDTVVKRRR